MATDTDVSAIRDLDPAAEIRYTPPGGWSVRLTNLLPGTRSISGHRSEGASREQAIERMWEWLMSFSEAATLYRGLGAQERVRWEGDQWVCTD